MPTAQRLVSEGTLPTVVCVPPLGGYTDIRPEEDIYKARVSVRGSEAVEIGRLGFVHGCLNPKTARGRRVLPLVTERLALLIPVGNVKRGVEGLRLLESTL